MFAVVPEVLQLQCIAQGTALLASKQRRGEAEGSRRTRRRYHKGWWKAAVRNAQHHGHLLWPPQDHKHTLLHLTMNSA